MKKLYSFIVALLIAQYSFAQWPANYDGVMLQAFYWDSYEDTKWTNLTSQADELSTYFDLLWIPNSGYSGSTSMGYMPIYWLKHTSSFGGRERYLYEMIDTYKEKGVGIISDVVINHKAPLGRTVKNKTAIDFVDEVDVEGRTTGAKYSVTWSPADICSDDDGGTTKAAFSEVSGAYDTGDDFSGARDLDHTGANVQKNCKTYLDYLIKEIGYVGFRLDMVKGYAAQFTKIYNEHAKPKFCVGEYWDGNVETLKNWVNGTGKTSAVFDFALKYVMRDAFGGGYWSALGSKGLAGTDYSRYAVTFIDNHDTYENQDRLTKNVLAAHALILALPGTPCIFLKHWQKYPIAIGNMILARKACGITNQSPIVESREVGGGYVTKVQGSKGTVLCISGYVTDYDTSGFKLIVSGTNYAYYVSNNVTVKGLREGNDMIDEKLHPTIYVAKETATAPYIYSWTEGGEAHSGNWPGTQMNELETVQGKQFWKYSFSVGPINIILSNGKGDQTGNIENLTHDYYFTYDGASGYTDITTAYWTPEVPVCVQSIEGRVYAYFRGNKDYKKPCAWVWNETTGKNYCKNKTWPGDEMVLVGYDDDNYPVYRWMDDGKLAENDVEPEYILISDNGSETIRTTNLVFKTGNYYDATGYIGTAIRPVTGIEEVTINNQRSENSKIYNLQGQRVSNGYRGVVIQNGRKYVNK